MVHEQATVREYERFLLEPVRISLSLLPSTAKDTRWSMIPTVYGHKTHYHSDDYLPHTLQIGAGTYRCSHFRFSTPDWNGAWQGLGYEHCIYGICIWGHSTMSDPDDLLGERYGL